MTCCVKPPCVSRSFPSIPPLPNPHALALILRHYVQSNLHLFDRSNIAKQNLSHRVNVICDGSPSRIRRVRRISFGMTILPRSSTLRTIPVAFMILSPLSRRARVRSVTVFAEKGELCNRFPPLPRCGRESRQDPTENACIICQLRYFKMRKLYLLPIADGDSLGNRCRYGAVGLSFQRGNRVHPVPLRPRHGGGG